MHLTFSILGRRPITVNLLIQIIGIGLHPILCQKVLYYEPLFDSGLNRSLLGQFIAILFSRQVVQFIQEALRSGIFLDKRKTSSWISSSYRVKRLLLHPGLSQLLKMDAQNTVLYF